jgi:ribosomal protein L17
LYQNFRLSNFLISLFTGESIKTANEQISECKKELEQAKTIRKNRQGDDIG